MNSPAPKTSPDEALSNLMGAALNVPAPLIQPAPVQRDSDGYWTHPAHPDFEEGQDAEAAAWFKAQQLEYQMESEPPEHPAAINYWGDAGSSDISAWEPPRPEGEGWFVLSIHDTEDWGPACVWVRHPAQQGKGGEK